MGLVRTGVAIKGFASQLVLVGNRSPEPTWNSRDALWLGGFLFLSLVSLFWLIHPWFHANPDAVTYLATTESLVRGEGYTWLGYPFKLRPPGFAVLIAPLVATSGLDFAMLNAFVGVMGSIAVTLLALLLRERLGIVLSVLVAISIWLHPNFRAFSNQIMSDVPFLAPLMATLLVERILSQRASWRSDILLGVMIGAATYLRTIGVLLLPSIVLARMFAQQGSARRVSWQKFAVERIAVITLATVLTLLPWSIRNLMVDDPPPVDLTAVYSYETGVLHVDKGRPDSRLLEWSEYVSRLRSMVPKVLRGLGELAVPIGKVPIRENRSVLPLALGVWLMVSGAYVLVKRRAPQDFFAFGVLAVAFLYFGFQVRLILPAYVFLFPACVEFLQDLASNLMARRNARVWAGALVLTLAAAVFEPRRHWAPDAAAHNHHLRTVRLVEPHLPPAGALAMWKDRSFNIYLGRPVYELNRQFARGGVSAVESFAAHYGITAAILLGRSDDERLLEETLRARGHPITRSGGTSIVRLDRLQAPGYVK